MRVIILPPFAMLMCLAAMALLHWLWPLMVLVPRPANWAGLALVAAGIGIARWHARLFSRLGTNINTFGEPGELTKAGLFRRTRNPMYLGMLTALAGAAWLLGSLSPWLGPFAFFALAQTWYIRLEEEAMHHKFGALYAQYQKEVPRWL